MTFVGFAILIAGYLISAAIEKLANVIQARGEK